jgi:hypothetical protein
MTIYEEEREVRQGKEGEKVKNICGIYSFNSNMFSYLEFIYLDAFVI